MKKTESLKYSINDFKEWNKNKTLLLAPKFQRRSVWTDKARSYLIDTILRDLPMPKVFMRQYIDETERTIREIVDGQQRIRSILNYLAGGFPVMRVHGKDEFGGKYYEDLTKETQEDFLNYGISVDLLIGATDIEVLGIFARLNTYGVRLNAQERINAKYFGHFKQAVYGLGFEFYRFWIENGILSEQDVARMLEAELTSELVIAMLSGIKSRKVIDSYYRDYDDELPGEPTVTERFKQCMDLIGEITQNRLAGSHFSSRHLFYSLYCAIYDLLYGLPGSSGKRVRFDSTNIARASAVLSDIDTLLSTDLSAVAKEEDIKSVDASSRHTTDISARQIRHEYLVKRMMASFEPLSS